MSNNSNISSYDISLLRKYVSKHLNDEEAYLFNAFLKRHPEYKEIVEGLTLADLAKIESVSNASVSKVRNLVNSGQRKMILWSAIAVLAIIVFYQVIDWPNAGKSEYEISDTVKQKEAPELISLDTSLITQDLYQKGVEKDTFYYVNTEEDIPVVAIEYIEEKNIIVQDEQKLHQYGNDDSLPQSNEKIKIDQLDLAENEVKELFVFSTSLAYRQSIAVEDNVAGAYKVGNTKSFAGPIGGYEYDPSGMPFFGENEEDLYDYINGQLSSDTLLTAISKKMEAKVSFEVDNKGIIKEVNVVKCNHKQLCLRLTEVIEQMPNWNPSELKGKKGSVHYVIEVTFE